MKNVAVFMKNYSIGKSSPVLCMLDFLSANYDTVDVYGQDVYYTKATVMENANVSFIEVPGRRKGLLAVITKIIHVITKPSCNKVYSDYVTFDPHGFILCMEQFPDSQPIYYSLELYFRDNHFNLSYPPDVIEKERMWINNISGLIIQSEERASLFRN